MLDLLKTPKATALSVANGTATVSQETPSAIVAVPLSQIADNPYQPRGNYDPEHILKLAASIKALKSNLPATMGLQQIPLARLVLRQRDGTVDVASRGLYERGRAQRAIHEEPNAAAQLMFGHSRLRAFELLNDGLRYTLKHNHIGIQFNGVAEVETAYAELLEPDGDYATMPLVLGFALDHEMWKHAITENSQRKNITAIEEAHSLQRAIDEFGLTTEEAGKPFGYARSTTANKIRLLALPEDVQKQISAGELTERHGRALLKIAEDPERVRKAATEAVKRGQNVKQLEESVDWEERSLKQEKEKARQLAHVRALLANGWQMPNGQTLAADRVKDTHNWDYCTFHKDDAKDQMLIEQSGCTAECECLILTYSDFRSEFTYRPDPVNAAHVCLCCTNRSHYLAKRTALGEVTDPVKAAAEAERKRQVEAINNEAHTIWQRWLKDQDKHALWNSLAFWRVAVKAYGWGMDRVFEQSADLGEACTLMLEQMYRNTREHNSELREYMHSVAAIKKLIKALTVDAYAGIQEIVEEGDDEQDED